MYNQIAQEYAKKGINNVLSDILGYWKVYDYLKFKAGKIVNDNVIEFDDIKEFWYSILKDDFGFDNKVKYKKTMSHQKIKLSGFYLSDWIPKLPGKIWTVDAINKIREADNYFEDQPWDSELFTALDPNGKMRHMSAGYGSIRLSESLYANDDFYYCLSANSEEFWNVDYGIPIVISKSVYNEYLKRAANGAPQVEIEGILFKDSELPFREIVRAALGGRISEDLYSILTNCLNLPKCFIYVNSPLLCKFKENNTSPNCTAWTCYENSNGRYEYSYLFTYSHFNPLNADSLNRSIEFINNYVRKYSKGNIITDFDGKIPRLQSMVLLNKDPLVENQKNLKEMLKTSLKDYNKIKRYYRT